MRRSLILKIVTSAILTAILFVQEELLTFIPNVQLTVLLILLYGAYCGIKWGSAIVLIHVLLDNLIVGSFTIFVMLPMYIGWEILLIMGYVVRNKNIFVKAITGGICSLIYCWVFVIANIFFYQIDVKAYMIADIPFEIIIFICSIITILWLYNPLYKVLKDRDVYFIDSTNKLNNEKDDFQN